MYNSESSSSIQLNSWQQWAFRVEKQLQEQQDTIAALQETVEQLQNQLEQQQTEQAQNKFAGNSQPPVFHVEKIEYHFDQLKVETLEGSLQIGMTTSSSSQLPTMIEDIALKQQANQPPSFHKENSKAQKKPSKANEAYNMNSNAPMKTMKTSNVLSYDQPTSIGKEQENLVLPAGYEQYVYEQLAERLKLHGPSFIRSEGSSMQSAINEEHITLMIDDLEKQLFPRIKHYIDTYGYQVFKQNARNEQSTWEQLQLLVQEKTWEDIESAILAYMEQQSSN